MEDEDGVGADEAPMKGACTGFFNSSSVCLITAVLSPITCSVSRKI